MKLTTIAQCIALIGVSSAATGIVFAQDKPVETVQKIEITGQQQIVLVSPADEEELNQELSRGLTFLWAVILEL